MHYFYNSNIAIIVFIVLNRLISFSRLIFCKFHFYYIIDLSHDCIMRDLCIRRTPTEKKDYSFSFVFLWIFHIIKNCEYVKVTIKSYKCQPCGLPPSFPLMFQHQWHIHDGHQRLALLQYGWIHCYIVLLKTARSDA